MNRVCKKCNIEKDITLFVKNKDCNYGHTWCCIDCLSKYNSSEKVRKRARKRYAENKEYYCNEVKKYRNKYPERVKENKKKEYRKNIQTYKAAYERNYKTPEGREKYNSWRRNKYNTDILFRLRIRLRVRLNDAIRDNEKRGSAVKNLGCSVEFLKDYLQSKFVEGMTWNNHGKVWHIDHIRPLCTFNLTDKEQFLKAFNYTNLQPLFIKDNLRKGRKTLNEFTGIPDNV